MVVYYKICGPKRELYRRGPHARREGLRRRLKVGKGLGIGEQGIASEADPGTGPPPGLVALVQAALARAFEERRPVVVLTGQEMSDESGAHLPHAGLLYHPREFELRRTWEEDPMAAEIWFEARLARAREAAQNPGHLALARVQREAVRAGVPFVLATIAIDGLHRRAGSRDVIELKGSVHERRCPSCGALASMAGQRRHFIPCARCGAKMEPRVALLTDPLPGGEWRALQEKARKAALLLLVGLGGATFPAYALAAATDAAGGLVVSITRCAGFHPGPATITFFDCAAELLPRLLVVGTPGDPVFP